VTQAEAWRIYDLFYEERQNVLTDEPRVWRICYGRERQEAEVRRKEWADEYLLAFAENRWTDACDI